MADFHLGASAATLPPPPPPPQEDYTEHDLGEATLPSHMATDTPELRRHWAATIQTVASRLWVTTICSEHLTISRDRTSLEPLIYIKLDVPDIRPIRSHIVFPVPPGAAHITVAGRLRVPDWDRFWFLKHRLMTYMTQREVTLQLANTGETSFPLVPHCEMHALISAFRVIIADFHVKRPGEDEAVEMGEGAYGLWMPPQHLTFYTLVEEGRW